MSKTFVYEITKPFEYNNRQYKEGDLLFEIEGREWLGIGDMVDGMIVNPIPAKIYADRIRPYRNMTGERWPLAGDSSDVERLKKIMNYPGNDWNLFFETVGVYLGCTEVDKNQDR